MNMLKLSRLFLVATVFGFLMQPVMAEDFATRDEAVKDVKEAVADLKSKGAEGVYHEISNPAGKYTKKDLYLVAYDLAGKCLAHGQNAALIGKDLTALKDIDGKFFVKERMELAQKQDSFWQNYKYMNPVTKSVSPKESYCEKSGEVIVCGGVYK